jgi:FKBP-type peptidyl-prolyl cis-trans isomerase
MKDAFAGKPLRMTQPQVQHVMMQFKLAMSAKMQAERERAVAENKAKNQEFLAKNAKDPAVKTLTNGMQYKVLKEGTGPMPKPSDTVTVSYKGSLIDGTVFDEKDRLTTRVTGQTIQGWSEILPLMKTGSKWEVVIPPELAYGSRGGPRPPGGSPPKIGPDAVLVFDMELLSIATPAPAAHGATPGPRAAATVTPATTAATPVVSGQIIKVPSAEEMKKGAKIEVITNVPASQ